MSADKKASEPKPVIATRRMKCSCSKWNNIRAKTIMLKLDNQEPKVEVFLPAYLPIETPACKKCKTEIANPKEIIRIVRSEPKKSVKKVVPNQFVLLLQVVRTIIFIQLIAQFVQ
jgi:hypothetical protein